MTSVLRNIFPEEESSRIWAEAVSRFDNKTPRFTNKDDAIAFIKQYCQMGSNPDDPNLKHSVTTLTCWEQVEKYLLPAISKYYTQDKHNNSAPVTAESLHEMLINNRFTVDVNVENDNDVKTPTSDCDEGELATRCNMPFPAGTAVYQYLLSRMRLPIYSEMSRYSTSNTLRYLFFHMRCGIFVMIRSNKLVVFCPFVNKDYHNMWKDALQVDSIDGSIPQYFQNKSAYYREENYLEDKSCWWANGNIICNEQEKSLHDNKPQYWGDHFLLQMKDMLSETCNRRRVPDCDFFLNKRDYPQLKFNMQQQRPVEPYGFIFDKDDKDPLQDVKLPRHCYKSYTPILSFYTSSRFADIPFPPSEDWEAATGMVFPGSFQHEKDPRTGQLSVGTPRDLFTASNLKKFEMPWEDKLPTAFFRGTATGGGVTVETNQRLKIAVMHYQWNNKSNSKHGKSDGSNGVDPPYLDAKVTAWNLRDKKVSGSKMTFIKKSDFPFGADNLQHNFVEIYKQSSYKYLVYIEGHCAACRYGFMMQLGSVILKVDSLCVADSMWYFPLLRPYYDHVPVKADLSDLHDKIEWCRNNDDVCRKIAINAQRLYSHYVSRDGVLDYMQSVFVEIAARYVRPVDWADDIPCASNPPYTTKAAPQCCDEGLCNVCTRLKERDDAQIQQNSLLVSSQSFSRDADKATAAAEAKKRRKEEKVAQERVKRRKIEEARVKAMHL